VIKTGSGSALMATPDVFGKIVAEARRATKLPLSVKIRKGFLEPNYKEIAHIAQEEGADMVVVHPRLRSEMFSGISDFSVSIELADILTIPVIHSGDIKDIKSVAHFEKTSISGLMIGRASFGHPWIFRQLKEEDITEEIKQDMIKTHFNAVMASEMHEKLKMVTIKKHAAWYATGKRGATQFRQELFAEKKTVKETVNFVSSFLTLVEEGVSC
jgi:tRNA-dihydrouridine synthase